MNNGDNIMERAELKERHFKRSDSIAALSTALAKAQGQIKNAAKDQANPFFKSKYADLASIMDACREPLAKNEIAVMQFPRAVDDGVEVETILTHSSGEWVSEVLTLPVVKADAQGIGSAITYARRYALAAITGVCPEDDDGNAAAAAVKTMREQTMAKLQASAKKGIGALEAAWKDLPNDARKMCQAELASLKETANAVSA